MSTKIRNRLFAMAGFLFSFAPAHAATLHVPADYPTIQSCIDAAISGQDECVVAPGTYHEVINFLGKAITLRSSDGPGATIIDGTGLNSSVVRFVNGETRNAVLDGFTITGGSANGPGFPTDGGGGIFCDRSGPTINNCIITKNEASDSGGGIYLYRQSEALITNSTISNNTASHGGGILCWLSNAIIRRCTIAYNRAIAGAGAYLGDCNTVIEHCTISDNVGSLAGGLFLGGEGNLVVTDSTIIRNSCYDRGGGVFSDSTNAIIVNSIISDNHADGQGGGVWGAETYLRLDNCTLTGNDSGDGGAVYCWADGYLSILDSTIVYNPAGKGISCSADGKVNIEGSIVWGNSGGQLSTSQQSQISVRYSDIQGGWSAVLGNGQLIWGPGSIDNNPLLFGPSNGIYHISPSSPCINAGNPDPGEPHAAADIDGEPRVFNGRLDIGADEYNDCNRDDIADYTNIASGQISDCTGNHIPDECEPDCNMNGIADSCDIVNGVSSDCDNNHIPDECQTDCNGNGVPDPCDILNGTSADCNGDGIPDECLTIESDCDANGIVDECDTASGKVQDCNGNGIPDLCEPFADCNGNGVLDSCELQSAPSKDANRDGILDECETPLVLYVDDDAAFDPVPGDSAVSDPAEDGTSMHPYDSIQEAIDLAIQKELANPGISYVVEIIVRPGTYKGPGNKYLTLHGRPYLLWGEGGPDQTLIDCEFQGQGILFYSGETAAARVNGLTITNGQSDYGGGGISCENASNPTFYNCRITGNTAAIFGGGVYSDGSSPTLDNCEISQNNAGYEGGGGYFSSFSNPIIRNSVIRDNHVGQWGGGLRFAYYCAPIILGCRIAHNSCGHVGGGISYDDSHPNISRCLITDNTSENPGGGIDCGRSNHSVISDSLVAGNRALNYWGGGIVSSGCTDLLIKNVTVANNSAPDIGGFDAWGGYVTIENSILWGNEPANIGVGSFSELTIAYSVIEGGQSSIEGDYVLIWGDGNKETNPLFIDPYGPDNDPLTLLDNDYRLSKASLCVNAGDPYFVPLSGETDLDGHPRVLCGRVDTGAYEFGIGDYDCNQAVNLRDFAAWTGCATGPRGGQSPPYASGCEAFDFNANGNVDLADFAQFELIVTP